MERGLDTRQPILSRRSLLFRGAAGTLALTGLTATATRPEAASGGILLSNPHEPAPLPNPIPGGLPVGPTGIIHIFLPGPPTITLPFSGLTLQGLDVEPSTITDFDGFTAIAFLAGTATGSDGAQYNLEVDIRAFEGAYVAANGATAQATFALIWIDLFEPGSGSQVHDLNGGIPANELFWTVELPGSGFHFSRTGKHAVLQARDVPLVDTFQIFGASMVPAAASFQVRWLATDSPAELGEGASVPPTDPAAFLGSFAPARAEGSFSASEIGFSFESSGDVSSELGYAELGRERNGVFLT